jgi:AraC-like DNA-binding protein
VLFGSNRHQLGAAEIRYGVAISPGVGVIAVSRVGMAYDAAYGAPSPVVDEHRVVLFVLLVGTLAIRGGATFTGPALLALPAALLDGARGGAATTYVTGGPRFDALIVHLPAEAYIGPAPMTLPAIRRVPLPAATRQAAVAAARALLDPALEAERGARVTSLLAAWRARKLLRPPCPKLPPLSPRLQRLWAAATRVWPKASTLTLDELSAAAQVGPRQLRRDVGQAFAELGLGTGRTWREAAVSWRLRLAVTLLSAPDATPDAVAHVLGYHRTSSMGRAFKNAGLPLPLDLAPRLQATARALERGAQASRAVAGRPAARTSQHRR